MTKTFKLAMLAAAALPAAVQADVRITEFMQTGLAGANREFFEITNLGSVAVDVANWSFNDNNPNNPVVFGNAFGSLAAGESVILTELSAADFRTFWGLGAGVRIFSIGGNSNLSSDGDTINIYNSATQTAANLVDSITFGEGTRGVSRNRPVGGQGNVAGTLYVLSEIGDSFGSRLSSNAASVDLGNPGSYPVANPAVPEPASWAMMIAGFGLVGGSLRRRATKVAFA